MGNVSCENALDLLLINPLKLHVIRDPDLDGSDDLTMEGPCGALRSLTRSSAWPGALQSQLVVPYLAPTAGSTKIR